MRISLVHLLRARPRPRLPRPQGPSLASLLEIEKNPTVPIFQKALAAMRVHYSLDNSLDDTFWASMQKFAQIEPRPDPDLDTFLRELSTRNLSRKQLCLVGDIAYRAGTLDQFDHAFVYRYIWALADPYRAIELAKRFQLGGYDLARLYIRANQLATAESLAQNPPDSLVVDLVVAHARAQDQGAANRWIKRLQAPMPEDLQRIKHFMVLYNLDLDLKAFGIEHERRPRLSRPEKRLVAALNSVLARYPTILEGDPYQMWARLLLGDLEMLEPLILALATETTLHQGDFSDILRHAPSPLALWLVHEMNYDPRFPQMGPDDWCAVLPNLDGSSQVDIELIVEQIRFTDSLVPNVISALCPYSPRDLVEMVLGLETPTEYQIFSSWKAMPTIEQTQRLTEVTLPLKPSLYMLRAIVQALAAHSDYVSIGNWVYQYQTRHRIIFPDEFTHQLRLISRGKKVSHSLKFPAPRTGDPDFAATLSQILPPWISQAWVMERIA